MLFHLYNRNHAQNHILFGHVLIWAGIFAAVGFLLFFALKRIVGGAERALLLTVLYWLCFWLFGTMLDIIRPYHTFPSQFFLLALGVVLILVTVLFRLLKPPFDKVRPAFNALAIAIVVLFAFNLTPAIRHNFALQRVRVMMASDDEVKRPFHIKRDFLIDTTLPAPDIYWFHLDGMISLNTMEWFSGEPQEHLREELSRMGFKIYDDVMLTPASTRGALSLLFSPVFADSFFEGGGLREIEADLELHEAERMVGELNWAVRVSGMGGGAGYEHFELLNALLQRGYILEHIGGFLGAVSIGQGHFPVHFFVVGALPDLLAVTTPLRFLRWAIGGYARVGSRLLDFGPDPLARFVFYHQAYTHMGRNWMQAPALEQMNPTAVHLYPLAFNYAAQWMLGLIDNVIEENPNAVIVLQSDHGLHYTETWRHLLDQGYTPEQVLELGLSVFSAVRIPDQYGGLEAPIAPLNISRELVNRFVGQNYNLLP